MSILSITGVIARFLLFAVSLPAFALDDFSEIEIYNLGSKINDSESKDAETNVGYSGYINFGLGWDSEKSNDYFLDLEVDFPSQLQLLFSASLYKSDVGFISSESKNYLLGLFNDPDEIVILGLEYDYYKEQNIYTIDTFRLTTGINVGDWALKVMPQRRLINGEFSILNRTPNGTSSGLGGEIEYTGAENWFFELAYQKFQYKGNALFDILMGKRPSPKDNLLARKRTVLAGIEDNRWAISANYGFDWGTMSLDWTRSVGVTKSAGIAFVYTFAISKYITDSFSLDLDLGSLSVSNDNEYLIFSSLSLTYYW